MQKVIGLDIGSYSIKAVEIVKTFKSYEIANFYENVIPNLEGVPMETIVPTCMEQLFQENDLVADRIVTAMPGQFISSRILTFNFSDPRKIQTAVFAEIEEAVPFMMEEMIIDNHVLGTSGGKTTVLAVMTRKAFLRNFLDLLQRIHIDPKLVDVDSLAFYNLCSYLTLEPGKSVALVDIGHEKTSVCIIRDGLLKMFRSINLGGRYVTDFLARDFETSFQEAQRMKHAISRVICVDDQATDLQGSDKMVAERSTLAASAIVKELGRTIYAYKTVGQEAISQILISGGTSNIKNFDLFLQDHLEVPVERLRLDATSLKINPELQPQMSIMPQGVAIGMRTVTTIGNQSQINLRKGEFAYVQNYEALLHSVSQAAKIVGIAVMLLLVSYGFQYFFYAKQIKEVHAQYYRQYGDIFADAKRKSTTNVLFKKYQKDAETRLHREIEQKRAAVDGFITENTASGVLPLMRDLSTGIPKDLKVDVTRYDFRVTAPYEASFELRAETDSYDNQGKLVDAIKQVSSLKDLRELSSGAKPGTNNSVIEFSIRANYDGRAGKRGA